MAATVVGGPRVWGLSQDSDGHREYKVTLQVHTDDPDDGPLSVAQATGAPTIGSYYDWENTVDLWALRHPDVEIEAAYDNEPNQYHYVTYTYSTKPLKRCQNSSIEDPLLEPQKVSGSFLQRNVRLEKDKNGQAIFNTSWEKVEGLEKRKDLDTVIIEQNVPVLQLALFTGMKNTVNDEELWDMPAGTIFLSNASWEVKLYGVCDYYFTRRFEFLIDADGWEIDDVLNEGWKVRPGKWVNGVWTPTIPAEDPPGVANPLAIIEQLNPQARVIFKDRFDENQPQRTALTALGDPLTATDLAAGGAVFLDPIEPYSSSNFLLLGIPTSLEVPV